MLTKPSFAMITRGPLLYIHKKKDPLSIPLHFKTLGYESFLLCWLRSTNFKELTVIELAKQFPRYIKYGRLRRDIIDLIVLFRLGSCLRKIKPSVVISYAYPQVVFATKIFLKLFGIKSSLLAKMDWDGTVVVKGVRKLYEKLILFPFLLFSDAICVESPEAQKKVASFAPFLKPKLHVIPSGVSKELIDKVPKVPREKIILTVARVARVKGLEILLKSFSTIRSRHPEWRLVIVGPVWDKKYFEELLGLCHVLNISNRVVFTNEITDEELAKMYGKASIFCLPSYYESCNSAMLEAMASGLPVVVTETGGSEYAKGAGIIVKIGDVNGLTRALERLIRSPQLRKKLGQKGEEIGKSFFWENIVLRWLAMSKKPQAA